MSRGDFGQEDVGRRFRGLRANKDKQFLFHFLEGLGFRVQFSASLMV